MVFIAETFGSTAHLSPLLRKVRHLNFCAPESLLRLAAARGCQHYLPPSEDLGGVKDPGYAVLGNEELGIAMISAAQVNDPRLIRCAAQLLSGPEISVARLARLARMERCVPLLSYIARQAQKWDACRPGFWAELLEKLPATTQTFSARWPHPSHFMIQAGYQRGGGAPASIWLRPRAEEASR